MKSQIADRLFMSVVGVIAVGTATFEPTSASYIMVHAGGIPSRLCMVMLLLAVLLALADTVINDMLPERYVFKTGWRFRQGIWMLIAVTFAGLAFVTIKFNLSMWLAATLTAYGARCVGISFIDLYNEQRDALKGRRSTDFGALDAN